MILRQLLLFLGYHVVPLSGAVARRRKAYVTVVTTENYVKPAMIMGASLRAHTQHAKRPEADIGYVCLVLLSGDARGGAGIGNSGARRLELAGWSVRPIPSQIMNPGYAGEEGGADYAGLAHVWNYNKLWVWSLTEFDRLVYLDSDLLVLGDVGDLFDLDIWTEDGAPANATHRNFAAAPDMIPPDKFNSGVMVLRPSADVFDDMRDAALSGRLTSYNKGDQGFLNSYFHDWYAMPPPSRLRVGYNTPYLMAQYEPVWTHYQKDIKIIHFYGDRKPWDMLGNPINSKVPKVVIPLLYLWGALSYLSESRTKEFLAEARYVCLHLFDMESDGQVLMAFVTRHWMKTPTKIDEL